jgi:hypothetical protein
MLESLEDFFVLESKGSRSKRGGAEMEEEDLGEGEGGTYTAYVTA